jgi:hypothetical protein
MLSTTPPRLPSAFPATASHRREVPPVVLDLRSGTVPNPSHQWWGCDPPSVKEESFKAVIDIMYSMGQGQVTGPPFSSPPSASPAPFLLGSSPLTSTGLQRPSGPAPPPSLELNARGGGSYQPRVGTSTLVAPSAGNINVSTVCFPSETRYMAPPPPTWYPPPYIGNVPSAWPTSPSVGPRPLGYVWVSNLLCFLTLMFANSYLFQMPVLATPYGPLPMGWTEPPMESASWGAGFRSGNSQASTCGSSSSSLKLCRDISGWAQSVSSQDDPWGGIPWEYMPIGA